ncbi:MAG: site-specific integrase [Desulfuromonas sp.]|uniref:tyrosine-type recombinase/integrase n=1 Tax=Desulfuromonas sp. TaxID=892 RepID=UPI000CA8FA13|nr:site-specific integrase [Desulfuromonas sp.]PLX83672.1 MAG: site-specific integrase [Desulfuromonas sp.]
MSVYRRKGSKIFTANFTIKGKRYFFSTGKTTKREARAVEAAERQKILNRSKLTPQEQGARTLLLDAIDQTYEARWKHGKDSMRSYRRAINLAAIIGNMKVSDITESTISQLTKTLESKGYSVATINRYLACLKTVLKQAKQPSGAIKLKKERSSRLRVISKPEEAKIVNLLRQTDHGTRRQYFPDVADLVEVLVDTGMRLSEALNMHYEDVDFDSGLISIWVNKGDRPRSIPMTRRVRGILERRRTDNPIQPFTLKPHQAETAWRWVRKELGLEGEKEFVLHALRHTTASRMVNAGIDLYVVKEMLGHGTIQVTERYAHLAPHKLAHAVTVLED